MDDCSKLLFLCFGHPSFRHIYARVEHCNKKEEKIRELWCKEQQQDNPDATGRQQKTMIDI